MDDAELAAVLRDSASRREITTFPDGSVDVYYNVIDGDGHHLGSREAFGERITAGVATFSIDRTAVTMGGQAVNMARQAHELGDTVSLYGFLDDARFDSIAFETDSMGEPATVYVYNFDGEAVVLADSPDAMSEWSLDTLQTAIGGTAEFEARMTADAVCCGNWVSFDGMTEALARLGERSLGGDCFVLDPGDLTTEPQESVVALCRALRALEQSYDVVISANGAETAYLGESLSVEGDGPESTLRQLRNELTITGVVLHEASEAVAATPNGVITVPNVRVEETKPVTGAGDRFSAGMAHGLAREWGFESALRLGNLCASYYVERGETGSRAALSAYAEQHARDSDG